MNIKTLTVTSIAIILIGAGVIAFFIFGNQTEYPEIELATPSVPTAETVTDTPRENAPAVVDTTTTSAIIQTTASTQTQTATPALDATRVMFTAPSYQIEGMGVRVTTGETIRFKVAVGKDITSVNFKTAADVSALISGNWNIKNVSIVNGYAESTYVVPETTNFIHVEVEGKVGDMVISNSDRELEDKNIEGSYMVLITPMAEAKQKESQVKGSNAAIKAYLNNARAQAELYYEANNRSYAGACGVNKVKGVDTINSNVQQAATAAGVGTVIASGALQTSTTTNCFATATAWAASVRLMGSPVLYYCVDYMGNTKETTKPLPANTAVCS